MAKTYRVAVIGRTGKGNYGHGLDVVWKAIDNVEIVAVADENEAGRAAAAQKLGAKNAYADYRQMLEKEKPQIVSVADRWLDAHHDMVLAALAPGPASSSKSRCAGHSPRPTRWSANARRGTSSWRSPTRRATVPGCASSGS